VFSAAKKQKILSILLRSLSLHLNSPITEHSRELIQAVGAWKMERFASKAKEIKMIPYY